VRRPAGRRRRAACDRRSPHRPVARGTLTDRRSPHRRSRWRAAQPSSAAPRCGRVVGQLGPGCGGRCSARSRCGRPGPRGAVPRCGRPGPRGAVPRCGRVGGQLGPGCGGRCSARSRCVPRGSVRSAGVLGRSTSGRTVLAWLRGVVGRAVESVGRVLDRPGWSSVRRRAARLVLGWARGGVGRRAFGPPWGRSGRSARPRAWSVGVAGTVGRGGGRPRGRSVRGSARSACGRSGGRLGRRAIGRVVGPSVGVHGGPGGGRSGAGPGRGAVGPVLGSPRLVGPVLGSPRLVGPVLGSPRPVDPAACDRLRGRSGGSAGRRAIGWVLGRSVRVLGPPRVRSVGSAARSVCDRLGARPIGWGGRLARRAAGRGAGPGRRAVGRGARLGGQVLGPVGVVGPGARPRRGAVERCAVGRAGGGLVVGAVTGASELVPGALVVGGPRHRSAGSMGHRSMGGVGTVRAGPGVGVGRRVGGRAVLPTSRRPVIGLARPRRCRPCGSGAPIGRARRSPVAGQRSAARSASGPGSGAVGGRPSRRACIGPAAASIDGERAWT
jgi:hypothetical protein